MKPGQWWQRWGWLALAGSLGLAVGAIAPARAQAIAHPDLLNGSWRLVAWGDPVAPKLPPPGMEAIANFDKGALIGSTGCNNYRTSYEAIANRLQVSEQIATTRRACPPPLRDLEANYLAGIVNAQHYRLTDANELEISYASELSWGVLRFMPAPSNERIIYVAPERADCVGIVPQRCLQIRAHPREPWQNLYQPIARFDYEPGYIYRLRIAEQPVPNPPADAPDRRLELVQILERVLVEDAQREDS